MISAVFRRGGDVSFVVEELKAVFDPRGGQWMNGRYVPSLLAAIGNVIENHLIEIGFIKGKEDIAAQAQGAGRREMACRRWRCGRHRVGIKHRQPPAMPQMRRSGDDPPGRLRPVPELRAFQVRVS